MNSFLKPINTDNLFLNFEKEFFEPTIPSFSSFFAPLKNNTKPQNLTIDILNNEKDYEVNINVAGLSKENIKLHLDNRRLTVTYQDVKKNESYYLKESVAESITRTVILPQDIDETNVSKATLKDGILNFRIPKNLNIKTTKMIEIE